ncbi:MAG: D-alanine--D-alanine ligase, partial [Mesorhizobium sp.]
ALCEDRRVSFTGSGSAASRLAFDKVATKEAVAKAGILTPPTLSVESATHDLVTYGKLVAKPIADGSSYGLLFVKSLEELKEFGEAVHNEAYLFEPFIAGIEATCGVLEHNGKLIALLP